ncbi:MAG: ABC transporter ATP-binding protein [Angelakisella sp.]|jgi:oligopeptide transport system ATP-binding protein|nr:ABC transporter ATP-binding protein [Angelakisella sp.]
MEKTRETVLRVEDLTVCFPGKLETVYAVNGISFHVDRGETLGIVGESGCGKSVSTMSVLGLVPGRGRVSGGRADFKGRDLLGLSRKELDAIRGNEIGIVFQDPIVSFNPVYTIGNQLMEPLLVHGKMDKEAARKKACEMLELVGITNPEERMRAYPHQFSGGMRQRAMIAMALICGPDLLIADEPTTALDVTIEAQIVELVKELQRQMEMGIIWISHDLGLMAGMADRIAVMYGGLIVETAPVELLYGAPAHPYTIGLLASLPRINEGYRRLESIEGMPPILRQFPASCPFANRCKRRTARCGEQVPPLRDLGGGHLAACWEV